MYVLLNFPAPNKTRLTPIQDTIDRTLQLTADHICNNTIIRITSRNGPVRWRQPRAILRQEKKGRIVKPILRSTPSS